VIREELRMNRSIASTVAALAMIALPPMTLARNQPTVQSVSFQLGGAPKVTLAAAAVRGGHTLSFLQSSEHPPGTVLPAGTVVHNCAQPLSGTVGVTVDATGYAGAAFGVVVKVGAATPIGVSSPQKGVVQFQGNVTLAQNSTHMVDVTVGTAPAAKPALHFNLVLKCVVVGAPAAAAPSAPAVVSKPPVTVAKPLGPMPAQVTPPQAGKGPAFPPSNVKAALNCLIKTQPPTISDKFVAMTAEVRPKGPWLNPPAKVRITVTLPLNHLGLGTATSPYPTPTFDYFKLPTSIWSPGGPHARVTLPDLKLSHVDDFYLGDAGGYDGLAKFGSWLNGASCFATYDAVPDTSPGHPLTP